MWFKPFLYYIIAITNFLYSHKTSNHSHSEAIIFTFVEKWPHPNEIKEDTRVWVLCTKVGYMSLLPAKASTDHFCLVNAQIIHLKIEWSYLIYKNKNAQVDKLPKSYSWINQNSLSELNINFALNEWKQYIRKNQTGILNLRNI